MAFPNDGEKFPKGKSGNPNGRPKKLYSEHIHELKAKGYVAPTKTEYFEMLSLMLAMSEADLKEFALDENKPYWIRLIIKDLNNANNRFKLMESQRDWLFGKAEQKTDITSNGNSIVITPISFSKE
jgi:hypothetical protein